MCVFVCASACGDVCACECVCVRACLYECVCVYVGGCVFVCVKENSPCVGMYNVLEPSLSTWHGWYQNDQCSVDLALRLQVIVCHNFHVEETTVNHSCFLVF